MLSRSPRRHKRETGCTVAGLSDVVRPFVSDERARVTAHARRVRRHLARHAHRHDDAARVLREIADRLLEHLDPVRLVPEAILDLGAATGDMRRGLIRRYPRTRVLSMDPAVARLRHGVGPSWRRLLAPPAFTCAEDHALPLRASSVDMVCCNLALSWSADLPRALKECRRVLRGGGLIMISTLGPDTLEELRAAWTQVDRWAHVCPFPDMHDIGDALVRARFADVVVDAESLQVEFDDLDHLLHEIRSVGPGNFTAGRNTGLTTPAQLRRLRAVYGSISAEHGCRATLEVVYAHAWAPDPAGLAVAAPSRRA